MAHKTIRAPLELALFQPSTGNVDESLEFGRSSVGPPPKLKNGPFIVSFVQPTYRLMFPQSITELGSDGRCHTKAEAVG